MIKQRKGICACRGGKNWDDLINIQKKTNRRWELHQKDLFVQIDLGDRALPPVRRVVFSCSCYWRDKWAYFHTGNLCPAFRQK